MNSAAEAPLAPGPPSRRPSWPEQGLQRADVAKKVGQSKEWTAAACLGQMTLDKEQSGILGEIFGPTPDEQKWL